VRHGPPSLPASTGVKNDLLFESPLWGVKRGKYQRRERILKPAEREKVRPVIKGGLKDFLFFLEMTGARPFSEAARITAGMINWEEGLIPFEKHNNASKGKTRTVYLPQALLERLRQLAQQHPTGPLFLSQKNKPRTSQAACKAMLRIERRSGVGKLTVYAWRHSYATDALAKGIPIHVLAELMGSSARTLNGPLPRTLPHMASSHDATLRVDSS
jgi:integrase